MRKMICGGLMALSLLSGAFLYTPSAVRAEETEAVMTEAGEPETEKTEAGGTVSAPSVGTPGWYTQDGYQYYYNKKGRLCTGWKKIGKKVYYFRTEAQEDAPAGSMCTGFLTLGSSRYYLSGKGVLQTGWVKIKKKYYYFAEEGSLGVLGSAGRGLQVIGGYRYIFDEDGSVLTGWQKYNSKKYYCSKKTGAGICGRVRTGWVKIGSYRYYFSKKGVLQTSKWVGSYYVNAKGRRLVSTVTPDGWIVDKNGKKKAQASGWVRQSGKFYYYKNGSYVTGWKKISGKYYYFNSQGVRQEGLVKIGKYTYYLKDGVRQTGWVRIDGYRYYFQSNGRMAVNTTVNGIRLGEDGRQEALSILIIAGHGQGDVGACSVLGSKTYYEYKCNREFATKIYNQLSGRSSKLDVVMYDQNYDCYQVVAGKKTGPAPNFEAYDYVLEIHFNATVESMKDLRGDGSRKGPCIYINAAKTDYTLERRILGAIAEDAGFPYFGSGVYTSTGLLNAKTCQRLGVSYALLETVFIDDRDDMQYYQKNKDRMAKAVADAIAEYFDL